MTSCTGKIWVRNSQTPLTLKGSMPQLLRKIVFMLEGGTTAARAILDDIDRDIEAQKDRYIEK